MAEYVCNDCGCTLTQDDTFIDAICPACGGRSPVTIGVYEDMAAEGDAQAYVELVDGEGWFAIGTEDARIMMREPVEITR